MTGTPASRSAEQVQSDLRRHSAAGVIAQYIHELAQPSAAPPPASI